ncbi:hypothetical protein QK292_07555 [Arthrobacter sp. AL08]|uniref:hypothetical protein n=1 Tax=Micrococcaceae TaxID=1268 RepID=UPI00249A23F6|nr:MULTISPECIES: hypothetical protein [Micrococcaceae]MDI3241313.1 hypothetical protein [Arthrobacter sp. AL05]MDI3277430.1 hypothetical protein [Arthrobacter sp. AL08]MDJ0354092.1 hypothetical protein [Pseudarthrobacter sp. PH31-O2]
MDRADHQRVTPCSIAEWAPPHLDDIAVRRRVETEPVKDLKEPAPSIDGVGAFG